MNANIFHLLPKIGALKQRVRLFEKEISREFGIALKLNICDMDASLGIDAIVKTVSNVLSVSMNKILSNERLTTAKEARQIAMFLCKRYMPTVTDKEIAEYFSKDRSNVIHSINRINALVDSKDESIIKSIQSCETEINAQIEPDRYQSSLIKA